MADERILVVDDEPDILSVLVYHLSRAGYRVTTAVNGPAALSAVANDRPDLVVLDLMLPGMDGYDVLLRMREDEYMRQVPVLLLTARREEEERVRGFEVGADDYLTKPFSARELTLRIQALLRRSQAEPLQAQRRLKLGGVELDREAHRAFASGTEMELTRLEYRLLETLMERRGRVQSREQLLEAVWDTTAAIETRTVDMHVARLRSKMGELGELVETVRGIGYRFKGPDL